MIASFILILAMVGCIVITLKPSGGEGKNIQRSSNLNKVSPAAATASADEVGKPQHSNSVNRKLVGTQ